MHKKTFAFSLFLIRIGWVLMTSLSLFLAISTIEYLSFRDDINFLRVKPDVVHHWIWRTSFYLHITASLVILAVAPFQFISVFRKKYPQWHRILGNVYTFGVLWVAAPAGLYMSFYANGGFWAVIGFLILSSLWIGSTALAYYYIQLKKIQLHQQWMVRSFALTFSAVTLRLYVPLLSLTTSMPHELIITLSAWLNWIPNLLIGEILMYYYLKKI
ncbi:MAG: DUF2306 domain-containing protein [Cytophagales bacterium]|nr:MAG: DUF2306 domain-containing protein [Cytophagales bacterium]